MTLTDNSGGVNSVEQQQGKQDALDADTSKNSCP